MIDKFEGKYFFLSNFYENEVVYKGLAYKSNEAAFQAQKTLDPVERLEFTKLNPSQAKRKGCKVKLREDWEDVKYEIMREICENKFFTSDKLASQLIATEDQTLIEGNTWHDNFWGICTCDKCKGIDGKNHLGNILMNIRTDLKAKEHTKELMEYIRENGDSEYCEAAMLLSSLADCNNRLLRSIVYNKIKWIYRMIIKEREAEKCVV